MAFVSLHEMLEDRKKHAHRAINEVMTSRMLHGFIENYCTLLDIAQLEAKNSLTLKSDHALFAQHTAKTAGQIQAYEHIKAELLEFVNRQKREEKDDQGE
jgi:hypothetical protein